MVRARTLAGFVECLAEMGGDPSATLRRAGLDRRDLTNPEVWLPFQKVLDAYNQAAIELDDPSFSMKLAQRSDLAYLGPIALLARHANTTRAALEDVISFIGVQNTGLQITLDEFDGLVRLRIDLSGDLRDSANLWMEDSLIRACQFIRLLAGTGFTARQILVKHRLDNLAEFRRLTLGATVKDEQSHDAVVFDVAHLEVRTSTADPQAHLLFTHLMQEHQLDDEAEVVGLISVLLETLVPMQKARLDIVADQLGLHPRTLQRHLRKYGLGFSELLDNQKCRIAERLLSRGELPLVDIAHYIGYSDQSAFNHAFHRWHKCSPSSWKEQSFDPSTDECVGPP